MSSTIVPKFIVNIFKKQIEAIHYTLLNDIAKEYNIPFDELQAKYIPDFYLNSDEIQIVKKRSYNINQKKENRCIAINSKNQQCKRSKLKNHTEYCVIHRENRRYGTINDKVSCCEEKAEKKWSKLY
jgi:antitoxin component of RelBE/YafQ-DinJ toxin-antitoxin module